MIINYYTQRLSLLMKLPILLFAYPNSYYIHEIA
jgi:hypothetical protein